MSQNPAHSSAVSSVLGIALPLDIYTREEKRYSTFSMFSFQRHRMDPSSLQAPQKLVRNTLC